MPSKEKERDKILLSEHVLEVRHEASGKLLDSRGELADYIRGKDLFPHWQIKENSIIFRDQPDKVVQDGAFAGYKSAGYFVYNPHTMNYFVDKATKYWKILLQNKYYSISNINRVGIRTKLFIPSTKSFDEVCAAFINTMYSKGIVDLLGDKVNDAQFILEFTDGQFEAKMVAGPVHEDEVNKYMQFESEHFEKCGLFFDLDYYILGKLETGKIPHYLKTATEITWAKVEHITSSMGL